MKIEAQNICNIETAALEVDGVAFLAGLNGAGKTSLCDAIGLIASGQIKNLKKDELNEFPRDGSAESWLKISSEDGVVRGTFPSGELKKTGGWGTEISPYAAGLKSLAELSQKDRGSELLKILKAEPTRDEWIAALIKAGIKKEVASTVAGEIMKGPDNAHNSYVGTGQTLKGRFSEVTGINWGSKQGGSWLPKDWLPSDEALSVETMRGKLANERDVLESLIRHAAINEEENKKLKELSDSLPELIQEFNEAAEIEKTRKAEYQKETEAFKALPRPKAQEKTVECPGCKCALVNPSAGVLRLPAASQTEEEVSEINKALADAQAVLDHLAKSLAEASVRAADLQAQVSTAKKAQLKLNESADEIQPVAEGSIEESRSRIAELEKQIEGTIAKEKADKIHQSILDNQLIIDVLKPSGLRKEKLASAFEDLNQRLEAISKTAGWNVTRITDDATITHGGYPYDSRRVSKGQRFRVRCALQIAFAQIQGCKLIVIDAADIMDGPGRKGLITVLRAYGIAAVISMTYNKRDDVQPFTTLDGFRVYWLDQCAQLLEKVAA